jgi:hypothetical protein
MARISANSASGHEAFPTENHFYPLHGRSQETATHTPM